MTWYIKDLWGKPQALEVTTNRSWVIESKPFAGFVKIAQIFFPVSSFVLHFANTVIKHYFLLR